MLLFIFSSKYIFYRFCSWPYDNEIKSSERNMIKLGNKKRITHHMPDELRCEFCNVLKLYVSLKNCIVREGTYDLSCTVIS